MQVTALFGGSFNPPTVAHRQALAAVQGALPGVPVVLLPAPRVAHKEPASLAPFEHRMRMAELAVAGMAGVSVSDFSMHIDSAQTVDLLRAWRAANGDTHIIWIMGADSFASLPQWDGWDEIMQTTSLYVLARPDQTDAVHHTEPAQRFAALEVTDAAALKQRAGWYIDHHFNVPVSATTVRAQLARGEMSMHLTDGVAAHIAAHGLYR